MHLRHVPQVQSGPLDGRCRGSGRCGFRWRASRIRRSRSRKRHCRHRPQAQVSVVTILLRRQQRGGNVTHRALFFAVG